MPPVHFVDCGRRVARRAGHLAHNLRKFDQIFLPIDVEADLSRAMYGRRLCLPGMD
jgi:hypothetical protein